MIIQFGQFPTDAHCDIIGMFFVFFYLDPQLAATGPRSAVGNVSGTNASLTADPGVTSSIPTRSHTSVETDHEIISMVILLSSAESFKSYKRKYVHEVLVNCLFKLAQEQVWLGELTVPP